MKGSLSSMHFDYDLVCCHGWTATVSLGHKAFGELVDSNEQRSGLDV